MIDREYTRRLSGIIIMSRFEYLCEHRESLRVAIRKKGMNIRLREIRSKWIEEVQQIQANEMAGFIADIGHLWLQICNQDSYQSGQFISLIYSKKHLIEEASLREKIRQNSIVSILLGGLKTNLFSPQSQVQVLQIVQKISLYSDTVCQICPHVQDLLQVMRVSFLDEVALILGNLLCSSTGEQVAMVLIRQQVEQIIAHRVESSENVDLWTKFLRVYIKILQSLRMQPHFQSMCRIISRIKKGYLEGNLTEAAEEEIELFLVRCNYDFADNHLNAGVVTKLIRKSSPTSLDVLLVLAHREKWIVSSKMGNLDGLVSSILDPSTPLSNVKLCVVIVSVILKKTKSRQFGEYIVSLLGMDRLQSLMSDTEYQNCCLDRLVVQIVESLEDLQGHRNALYRMLEKGWLPRNARSIISNRLDQA